MNTTFTGINKIGLFLNEEEAEKFITRKAAEEEVSTEELLEISEADNHCVVVDYRFVSGSIQWLDGNPEPLQDGLLIFARRQGGLLKGSGYRNPSEMAEEFKGRYGKYLPDNFDYTAHIARVTGVLC
jgi:hypothetical protein